MDMRIHWVKTIKLGDVAPVSDAFYRRITVQTDKGEEFDLVLFSNKAEDLWISSKD